MCLHCKLFEDEVKPNQDMIDSLFYSMKSRLKNKEGEKIGVWRRIECKGVGDNDGFYELTTI